LELYAEQNKPREFPAIDYGPRYGDSQTLDVPKWLSKHGVPIIGKHDAEDATRWYIECPGKAAHTGPNAFRDCCITQDKSGKLGGCCFHQSCGMNSWASLRDAIGGLTFEDFASEDRLPDVDFSQFMVDVQAVYDEEVDEVEYEDFCWDMVPPSGLIRSIFDYYTTTSYYPSNIIGLATSLTICETVFGRKLRSHTGLRTNDYNVVLAPTCAGKESAQTVVTNILGNASPNNNCVLANKVASGNGLLNAIKHKPVGIWVQDEFGLILQGVLDKRANNHVKEIATNLLELYSKSNGIFFGAAHADGVRNELHYPHLCVLGFSTSSTTFEAMSSANILDGLFARIAFWPVRCRPDSNDDYQYQDPCPSLLGIIKDWIEWTPNEGNLASLHPKPVELLFTESALARWDSHQKKIRERMKDEPESRAAIWGRTAARSMKLAMVSRAARLTGLPSAVEWAFIRIEDSDIDWAIKLSNWLANISCRLVRENMQDASLAKAKKKLLDALAVGDVNLRSFARSNTTITEGDLEQAIREIGAHKINRTKGRGRPSFWISWQAKQDTQTA
jgi:hypothetical protein